MEVGLDLRARLDAVQLDFDLHRLADLASAGRSTEHHSADFGHLGARHDTQSRHGYRIA